MTFYNYCADKILVTSVEYSVIHWYSWDMSSIFQLIFNLLTGHNRKLNVHRVSSRAYHRAICHIRLIPDRNPPTGVEGAEARRNVVWIARTRHGRRTAASRCRPLEPTLRSQRHLLRTRVYRSHILRQSTWWQWDVGTLSLSFSFRQRLWLRLGVNIDDQLSLRLNPIPIPNCNPSTNPSPSRNTNTN